MNQAFTVAFVRAIIGAVLLAGATLLTTWGATDAELSSKAILVPTLTTFVGYVSARFAAEGWIDTKNG